MQTDHSCELYLILYFPSLGMVVGILSADLEVSYIQDDPLAGPGLQVWGTTDSSKQEGKVSHCHPYK